MKALVALVRHFSFIKVLIKTVLVKTAGLYHLRVFVLLSAAKTAHKPLNKF